MERQFILPITFAAVLHAGLLFGVHGHAIEIAPALAKARSPKTPEPPQMEITPLPPDPDTVSASAPAARASEVPISLEDHPVLTRTSDFTVEIPRADPTATIVTNRIPVGAPGIPGGIGIGGPQTLSLKDLDGVPRARMQTQPNYPFEARRNGLAGEVIVEFTVDESGAVLSPRVVRSSDRVFEESALHAVARWKFEPGLRGGRAVRFRMAVPIVFSLNEN